ncbi:GNAT family N-acetyltransferase [Wenxinia saemankumensis]|uniref:GNAT family N-acetyltransferase n=1 Tax=Wenxinia saemankumensis TaxID=1447782 RepID=UPI0009350064|nr:GNAT family protein [Wenxinia saemankumensis]
MIPTFHTARLALRPFRPSDAPALASALDDWEVTRWLSGPPWPYSEADARAFIAETAEDGVKVWAIARKGEGLVGSIALGAEIGYWVRRACWRRGYGGEALQAVLARHFAGGSPDGADPDATPAGQDVRAGVHPDNLRSTSLLRKSGFVPDGTDRTWFPCRGAMVDRPMFRLTRPAWEAARRA